jgi:hypothetical protein
VKLSDSDKVSSRLVSGGTVKLSDWDSVKDTDWESVINSELDTVCDSVTISVVVIGTERDPETDSELDPVSGKVSIS